MGRRPFVPPELKCKPFTLEEARAAGLTPDALRGKSWRRIGSGLYCWTGLREDPWQVLVAWRNRLRPYVTFAELTAAWLFRIDVDPCHPIQVVARAKSGIQSRPGLMVRHCALRPDEIVQVRGLPTTSIQRTFRDLRRRLTRVEYLVLADEALRRGLGRFDELAEPAESPMETRLRWVLIEAGLPRPQVQTDLQVGRADLFFPRARLVIEYDGGNHRDRMVEDDRRQNALIDAGFRILRYTASDVYQKPDLIVTQVRRALAS